MNRPEFDYIYNLIPAGNRVLDLGCGDGDLLQLLKQKKIKGQGIEKDEDSIYKCIEKGLVVHHGDLDDGLEHHLDKSFDYVILNRTIQETKNPGSVIIESLRIGKKVIVCFPNFGHWKIRFHILFEGTTPVTDLLPYHWYNTPNLHFLSVTDFREFCHTHKIKVEKTAYFKYDKVIKFSPNYFATLALYVLNDSTMEKK
ncbi:MAG: methionine biosynthesis protein MetW [Leptospiraceae bacterium]|nr:methionine biosynthesis protein MetW [Leptospiraceae bacterium]